MAAEAEEDAALSAGVEVKAEEISMAFGFTYESSQYLLAKFHITRRPTNG